LITSPLIFTGAMERTSCIEAGEAALAGFFSIEYEGLENGAVRRSRRGRRKKLLHTGAPRNEEKGGTQGSACRALLAILPGRPACPLPPVTATNQHSEQTH